VAALSKARALSSRTLGRRCESRVGHLCLSFISLCCAVLCRHRPSDRLIPHPGSHTACRKSDQEIIKSVLYSTGSAWKHTYTHTYVRTYLNTNLPTYTHIHTCIYICIHIHTYIHTYIYIYTRMHAYIHTYVHTYIHTFIK
jgi:hypothetical protein